MSSNGVAADKETKAKTKKPSGLPPVDHGYAWVIVAAATVIFMLSIGVFRTQTVFLEPVREKYKVTHGMMTLMATLMSVASQLITLPGNVLNEWLGPRVNVIAAGVCGVACYVICAFAPNFLVYFLSYVLLQGAAFALCYSPVVVTVNRYFKVYRPLASSIALGGVSIGTMVIPNVLRAIYHSIEGTPDKGKPVSGSQNTSAPLGTLAFTSVPANSSQYADTYTSVPAIVSQFLGLRWILLGSGLCMLITIPIAFLLRTITMEQLTQLDVQLKKAQAEEKEEKEKKEAIELGSLKEGEEKKEDPDAITSEPEVVGTNGASEGEKKDGTNDLETHEKLLTPAPAQPQPAPPVVEKKKGSDIAAAFAYFKLMPSLFKNPVYLIHALHFAVMMCVDMIFMSVTFDSFLKEMQSPSELVFTSRTSFAIGNFVGRFASGLFVVMPVFIAKCQRGKQGSSSGEGCYDKVKKYVTVRILYCGASAFFVLSALLLAIAGMSGGAGWSGPLVGVYILVGLSGGCLFSQFPVVLAELVGVQRLAAGHALFMLIQVPVNALQFICGLIKSGTGSWGIAYVMLFIFTLIITIVNCASLLLEDRLRRCLCRKSAQSASA